MGPTIGPAWTVGKRVLRPDGSDSGLIVEAGDEIKVLWDSGRTSYFQVGQRGNVALHPLDAET